jgi:nicotinate-nucleotide pyrophosphorylase (carboxylating)
MSVSPLPLIMIEPLVRAALLEDLGRAGDLTTDAIVPAETRTETVLVARQAGVVAGLDLARLAFQLIVTPPPGRAGQSPLGANRIVPTM